MSTKYTHWFPLSSFKDESAAKAFQCSICEHVPAPEFVAAHEKCGAVFCFSCVLSLTFTGGGCAKCGESVTPSICKKTGKELAKLVILCPWHEDCTWTGKMSDMKSHEVASTKCIPRIKRTAIKKSPKRDKKRKALGKLDNEL